MLLLVFNCVKSIITGDLLRACSFCGLFQIVLLRPFCVPSAGPFAVSQGQEDYNGERHINDAIRRRGSVRM